MRKQLSMRLFANSYTSTNARGERYDSVDTGLFQFDTTSEG